MVHNVIAIASIQKAPIKTILEILITAQEDNKQIPQIIIDRTIVTAEHATIREVKYKHKQTL